MNCIKKQKTTYAKEKILEIIESGNPNDQLLPETAMAKQLKVGEITVRRALKLLVDEGLIYRVRGSGTFISEKPSVLEKDRLVCPNFFISEDINEALPEQCVLNIMLVEDQYNYEICQKLVEEYKNNHPHIIDIKINHCSPNNAKALLMEDLKQNDIITINPYQACILAKENYVMPLSDLGSTDSFENINDNALKTATYDEKIWLMPKNVDVFYLYYNKKLFDKAGIPYPDENMDWDTYLETAKELTLKKNGSVFQFGTVPHRDMNYFAPLVWSFGGDFADQSGNVTLTDPETMDAVKYGIDLTMRHKVTQSPSHWLENHLGQTGLFRTGKLAMYITCSMGQLNNLRLNPDLEWGIAPLPKGKYGRFTSALYYGWSISSKSRHPEESFKLIKFLASNKSASKFADNTNIMPATREPLYPNIMKSDENIYSVISTMLNSVRNFPFEPSSVPVFAKIFYDMLIDVYYEKKSFSRALKDTQKEFQNKMKKELK